MIQSAMQSVIEAKLGSLNPQHLVIENESHMHSGPATDSHFKVTLVSDAFTGVRTVARHQKVYGLLAEELKGSVHALALHLYTPEEWNETKSVPDSPQCLGGSKHA
ncbi:MAG: BolA family protein [Thalassolituus sp.]